MTESNYVYTQNTNRCYMHQDSKVKYKFLEWELLGRFREAEHQKFNGASDTSCFLNENLIQKQAKEFPFTVCFS